MRVRVDKSLVMEVESVQLSRTDANDTIIVFKALSSEVNDPYIEFMFSEGTTLEDAEKICEPMMNNLLEKGYADFSEIDLEIL